MTVDHELVTYANAESLASRAAEVVAGRAEAAIKAHGQFTFAASGGKTPWAMFAELVRMDVQWRHVQIFQVDERVAPDGDPDRNLTHLVELLGDLPVDLVAMPVTDPDPEASAASYAAALPERFDLIHLGLGPDGHTASLVPGDHVLEVSDRLVALTAPYQGHRRMTLTYPALSRAEEIVWLVSGQDKRDALARLLAGDTSIPAGRVEAARSTILADAQAAGLPGQ